MSGVDEIIAILKLEPRDLEHKSLLAFNDYNTCVESINKIVVEIARYAMIDISRELDYKGQEIEPPGSKKFHSRTLNDWVEQKCRAVLLPFSIPEDVVKRAVKSIMSRTYDKDSSIEQEWEKEDSYQTNVFELGECLKVGNGYNVLGPTRYVVYEQRKLRFLISPYPTNLLRKEYNDLDISLNGILRTVKSKSDEQLPKLQEQSVVDYANVPEGLKELLLNQDPFARSKELRKYIEENFSSMDSSDFFEIVDIAEESDSHCEKLTEEKRNQDQSFNRFDVRDNKNYIPCFRLYRFGKFVKEYFIAIPKDSSHTNFAYRHDQVLFYKLGNASLWKYITRIFLHQQQELPAVIRIDETKLHFHRTPPASGMRIIIASGGNHVRKKDSKYNRGYYEFPTKSLTDFVKDFMLDYCLYREDQ